MAFVVEDGTVVANANSLCSVAFADAYFSDRAITAWTGTQADKESALIRATDYIETRFESLFIGSLVEDDQPLSFPREDVGHDDVVPPYIQKACAEYALRALSGELVSDPTSDASGLTVASKSTKVGPVETSVRYARGHYVSTYKSYPAADSLIRPFLRKSNGVVR